jgi:hypothetical protein
MANMLCLCVASHSNLSQPYVTLSQGGARAEDSLLVDYVMSKCVTTSLLGISSLICYVVSS